MEGLDYLVEDANCSLVCASANEHGSLRWKTVRRAKPKAHRAPPGSPPGSPIHDPESPHPRIKLFGYGPTAVVETDIDDPSELSSHLEEHPMVWVNVAGLGDLNVLRNIATVFELHHLALEDVVHVHQRPKVEVYGEHTFVVLRMLSGDGMISKTEQFSLFLGVRFVLTFQERVDDALEPIRQRLRKIGPRMHGKGPDYLAYAIIDTVVDSYFPVLETLG